VTAIEFTDRYEGIGQPHPWRYCRGACEATGVVHVPVPELQPGPAVVTEEDPRLLARARQQHAEMGDHECDGWHFVTCPDCNGTRLASWPTAIRATPSLIRRDLRFLWQHGITQYSRPQHWTRRKQLAVVLGVIFGRRA
jgi:hypothetical protein